MTSLVAKLLAQKPHLPTQKGRVIRFDTSEPSIMLVTGSMPERVLSALNQVADPMTAREIATCIGSNPSRVTATLKTLLADDQVVQIRIEGCITEYMIAKD